MRVRAAAGVDGASHGKEGVDHSGIVGELHGVAFALEPLGVGDAFVTQRIVLGDDNERGGASARDPGR